MSVISPYITSLGIIHMWSFAYMLMICWSLALTWMLLIKLKMFLEAILIWKILVRQILFFPWPVTLCWENFEKNIFFMIASMLLLFLIQMFTYFLLKVKNDVINQKEYASIIESLRYVTDCTRPGITYAVRVLGRFTSKPGNEH